MKRLKSKHIFLIVLGVVLTLLTLEIKVKRTRRTQEFLDDLDLDLEEEVSEHWVTVPKENKDEED